GEYVAAAINRDIWLWDVATGKARSWRAASSPIILLSLAFSPDGKLLASGSCAGSGYADLSRCTLGEIRLWDMATGTMQATLTAQTESVYCLAFSPDGTLLASRSTDNAVLLWDVRTGTIRTSLTSHNTAPRLTL